ncbi:unnamed protein product [Thelazia callipaeda]|uniref:PHD-type domain-containing protein n=1 Tax=Thelazia callipaeda TaxID=103827 RepID=A0A0N5D7Y1_THECL|nr:unnamed protein product [Thelazia callipaeda]
MLHQLLVLIFRSRVGFPAVSRWTSKVSKMTEAEKKSFLALACVREILNMDFWRAGEKKLQYRFAFKFIDIERVFFKHSNRDQHGSGVQYHFALARAFLASRAPGKRQIKPNANVLLNTLPLSDSDEDDDFVVGKADEDCSSNSDSGSSSSDGDEDDEPNDAQSSHSNGSILEESQNKDVTSEMNFMGASGYNFQSNHLICTLCLNLRAVVRNDEVIQCDKCGVAVHENCYIIDNQSDSESDGSSSSTEPWFCEPCLYGLKEPPYCELCPNRFGAFKKADIGGGWVHLLCALYTHGITFGDVERLSAVSWQEQDYKLFGKKACVACSDPLLARTGIAVPCDAALCKNHLHVTCAQKLGLLVDNTENTNPTNSSDTKKKNSSCLTSCDVETVDPLYLTCKRHGNEALMRQRKAACALVYAQEEARMLKIRRRVLNDREERKRIQMAERHKKALKDLEGITIVWPESDNKRPRMLHTSPQYLELFLEKAESNGKSRQKFLESFTRVDGAQLPYLPPGFSSEFIEYFNHRENYIIEETKKVETLKRKNESLETEHKKLLELLQADASKMFADDSTVIQDWYDTLHALGLRKLPKEKPTAPTENKTKYQNHIAILIWKSMAKKVTSVSSPDKSQKKVQISPKPAAQKNDIVNIDNAKGTDIKMSLCEKCRKSFKEFLQITDENPMTQCSDCLRHFHLTCLESSLFDLTENLITQGWKCSLCSSSNNDGNNNPVKILNAQNKEQHRDTLPGAKKAETCRKNSTKSASVSLMDETASTGASSVASTSGRSPTTGSRKRQNADRRARKTVSNSNGVQSDTSPINKSLDESPTPEVVKKKRECRVNSLPPTLPKLESNETAHLDDVAQN